jgi:hypothetical protein
MASSVLIEILGLRVKDKEKSLESRKSFAEEK